MSTSAISKNRRRNAPGRARTSNPRFRRPMLYPIELRMRIQTVEIGDWIPTPIVAAIAARNQYDQLASTGRKLTLLILRRNLSRLSRPEAQSEKKTHWCWPWRMLPASKPTLAASATTVIDASVLRHSLTSAANSLQRIE